MLCLVCNEDIYTGDEIKCVKCNDFLHFGCASFREASFRKLSNAAKETWSCSGCKTKKNTNTITAPSSFVNTSSFSNDTIADLVKSVKFMSEQFDNFNSKLKEIMSNIKILQGENKLVKEQNIKLSEEVSNLSKRINQLEQKSLENNVEILGVQEEKNENCVEILNNIASKLNVSLSVCSAYRTFSSQSNKHRKIVAILDSKEHKYKLITEARKLKLNAHNLNTEWASENIYINEQMTQSNKYIFFKARAAARELGYKFIWFKNSKIFVKKDETSKALLIGDEKALSLIV